MHDLEKLLPIILKIGSDKCVPPTIVTVITSEKKNTCARVSILTTHVVSCAVEKNKNKNIDFCHLELIILTYFNVLI